jgi:hypothetical protein
MSDGKKDELENLIDRTSSKIDVYTGETGYVEETKLPVSQICFPSDQSSDIADLFMHLPDIIRDHLSMMECVHKLATIVVQQQIQIDTLLAQIDAVKTAAITVKIQDSMNSIVDKLTESGRDVTNPKVIVNIEGSADYKSERSVSKETSGADNETTMTNVTGEIKGLLDVLAGVNFGYKNETSKATQHLSKLVSQKNLSETRSFKGRLQWKFESVSGDPRVKAEAEVQILNARAAFKRRIKRKDDQD